MALSSTVLSYAYWALLALAALGTRGPSQGPSSNALTIPCLSGIGLGLVLSVVTNVWRWLGPSELYMRHVAWTSAARELVWFAASAVTVALLVQIRSALTAADGP